VVQQLQLHVGVKADPIEYRFSYDWLFRLMADEGIQWLQLGTFFEIYDLPDDWFRALRRRASDFGVEIHSVFTAHRELGGFFRCAPEDEAAWGDVAKRKFQRLIEVGGLLGAWSVGSNPGALLRDQMGLKPAGLANYLRAMKDLMRHARRHGVQILGIEPMSCLAEPPTLPTEISALIEDLWAWHRANADETSTAGLCADVSHGYADRDGTVVFDNLKLIEAGLPYTHELHLKNTDNLFNSTFGFTEKERARGIVDVRAFRDFIIARAAVLPYERLVGYLEIGGPKLGRDYADHLLEAQLRESLRHVKAEYEWAGQVAPAGESNADQHSPGPCAWNLLPAPADGIAEAVSVVKLAPSMMCADMGHFEEELRRLEAGRCEWLHWDLMDAHFVPNMPLGLGLIQQARRLTNLPFDVHLMVEDNDFFIEQLGAIGVEYISVHAETARHLDRTLALIKSTGARAGLALNPSTPLTALEFVLERLDYVLIMTVNPGYAGQTLVPSALRKIAATRAFLDEHGAPLVLEVDGNVSFANIPPMVAAGADVLVAGTSSVFHAQGSRAENIARTRLHVAEGLARRPVRAINPQSLPHAAEQADLLMKSTG
jgi:ribulose-phosphate 3-epimerase